MPHYEMRVKDYLDDSWSEWFDGLSIMHDTERSETILSGPVIDQTALYTLLEKARDLSLTLLSVNLIDPSSRESSGNRRG